MTPEQRANKLGLKISEELKLDGGKGTSIKEIYRDYVVLLDQLKLFGRDVDSEIEELPSILDMIEKKEYMEAYESLDWSFRGLIK